VGGGPRRPPPPPHPARPLTVSCGRPPRKKERRATAGRALRSLGAEHGSALQNALQDQTKRTRRRPRPFCFPSVVSNPCSCPPSPGNCRWWDGGGWQDRRRHEWRHRAPMGEGALLAKHCFASARTHSRQRLGRTPEGGLRRVLPAAPVPPNYQQPRAALDVDVDVDVARRRRTTARQRGASTSSPIGQLTPVPPIPQ